MKTKYILSAVLISAVMLTACEKDKVITPNKSGITSSKTTKNLNSSDKSDESIPGFEDGYWDDIRPFILGILDGSLDQVLQAEKALYYTESTVDWRTTGSQRSVDYRLEGDSLTFTISGSMVNGQLEFSPSDVMNLNNNIYSSIATQAQNFSASQNDSVIVDFVDLTWSIQSNIAIVTVKALYGIVIHTTGSCTFAAAKAGIPEDCNGNPFRSAAQEIDRKTRPLSCGYWKQTISCNLKSSILINPKTSIVLSLTPCGSFLWHGSVGTCRSGLDNQTEYNDVRDSWNNCFSTVQNAGYLRSIYFFGKFHPPYGYIRHEYKMYTATACKFICTVPSGCYALYARTEPVFFGGGVFN